MGSLLSRSRAASAFFVVLAATGCTAPAPPADRSDPIGTAASALFGNDQTSFDYFVGKGLTAVQAAGIVGNLDQESGDSPTAVQSGGPGRGVAQWSAGGRWDTSAGDNEKDFVTNMDGGASKILDLSAQLDFIWYELTTFPGYGLASLKTQTTVSGATIAFMTDFEICGTCDATNRTTYAQAVYDAYGDVPYAATFVAQSFPLATTTLTMTAGQVLPSYIELKNSGSKAWDANTKLGTTEPRDRVSVFADKTWPANNRPAAVKGSVAPGATYKLTFDLAAPMTPGMYDEHFGVLEEGVAWFGDPGQGGPADSDLEVKIQVVAAPSTSAASGASSSSGGGAGGAGATSSTSGAGGSVGNGGGRSGETSSSSGSAAGKSSAGSSGGSSGQVTEGGGCAVGARPSESDTALALAAIAATIALGRRRAKTPLRRSRRA